MPQAVAEAVEAPPVVAGAQPVVLVEVRDVADLGKCEAPPAAARRRPADFQLAEAQREGAQLLVGDVLVVEHHDGMGIDRPPQRLDRRRINGVAQVEAADFGADMGVKLCDGDGHAPLSRPVMRSGSIDPPFGRCQSIRQVAGAGPSPQPSPRGHGEREQPAVSAPRPAGGEREGPAQGFVGG